MSSTIVLIQQEQQLLHDTFERSGPTTYNSSFVGPKKNTVAQKYFCLNKIPLSKGYRKNLRPCNCYNEETQKQIIQQILGSALKKRQRLTSYRIQQRSLKQETIRRELGNLGF